MLFGYQGDLMKVIQKTLLFFSLFCSTLLPQAITLTPANSFLAFDLDDVLIEKSVWHKPKLVLGGIAQDPFNAHNYLNALREIKSTYQRDSDGIKQALRDSHGNEVMGLTFHFLHHGMRNKQLTPYVAWLVKTMENSRCFINGTKKIMLYLKSKGFTIVFATNKDRVSYDLTAEAFGPELTQIPDRVFVAQPGNVQQFLDDVTAFANRPDTPESYRVLAERAINVPESATIFHAPGKKPHHEYYNYVHSTVGADKNMIFIDDKKTNVSSFNTIESSTNTQMKGIHFKNPIQLANDLVKLGILSEIDDHKFLQEIRNPGIMGKIRLQLAKIATYSPAIHRYVCGK